MKPAPVQRSSDLVVVNLHSSAGAAAAIALRDIGSLFSEVRCLFKRVRHLQDAEVFLVAADDLQSDR